MPDNNLNVVYILTNSAMPGLVKIGKTSHDDPNTRVSQLYTTGVPVPFDIEYACKVSNFDEVENALHTAFAPQRINPRREFFEIEPEQAIAVLRLLNVEEATEEVKADSIEIDYQDKAAADRLRSRRPNLDFDEMGIPTGSILQFSNTDDTISVVNSRKVRFRDQDEMSLSAVTRQLLGLDYNVSPARYWSYNGKSLKEIYDETYTEV